MLTAGLYVGIRERADFPKNHFSGFGITEPKLLRQSYKTQTYLETCNAPVFGCICVCIRHVDEWGDAGCGLLENLEVVTQFVTGLPSAKNDMSLSYIVICHSRSMPDPAPR